MGSVSKRKRWFWIFGTITWALLILVLCLISSDELPNPGWKIPYADKWVHFGLFFVLAFFLYAGVAWGGTVRWKIWVIVLFLSFLYGGIIEWLQANFFHRSGDIWDLAADLAGAVVGCLFYLAYHKGREQFCKVSGTS
ncbi:MAG: VanZ family protein [Culturomica sp.]|jgi:VanZ family protein|nr:VanZ family protein [Culturomica sp.]